MAAAPAAVVEAKRLSIVPGDAFEDQKAAQELQCPICSEVLEERGAHEQPAPWDERWMRPSLLPGPVASRCAPSCLAS
jgi:hypothetical protein